jgi:cytochrome c biogenesis protein CcdA/thiol-disulfide isomerase/thioredoxin
VNNPSPPGRLAPAGDPSFLSAPVTAVYFYGDGCEHCEKIKPLIQALQAVYPELQLERLEVYHNTTNQQRFVTMTARANLSSAGVPLVFIGGEALVGETEIKNHLEERILAEKERLASCNTTAAPSSPQSAGNCTPAVIALTPQMVVVPALADSLNPCALSVLIFLLISIAAAGDRRRILLIGGSYIAAVFLFHLLMGIGLFSVISLSGYSRLFSLAGALVALVLGAITVIEVIRNREVFLLSVPASGKGILATYVRIASLPAAFVLGVLAGLLGFSCTGGIYISILGLMGRSLTLMDGLPWLVLYNIVFVLPLVLVTLLVAYGVSAERADAWRTEHKRALRLVIGLIMCALGLAIFAGWFG